MSWMRYWTVKDVAKRFQRTPRTIRQWIHQGKIDSITSPGGRGYLIPDSAIRAIDPKNDMQQAEVSGNKDLPNR